MSHFARNNMVEALARFVGLITSDAIACHPRIRLSGSSPFRIYPSSSAFARVSFPFPSLLSPPPPLSSNPTLHPRQKVAGGNVREENENEREKEEKEEEEEEKEEKIGLTRR